MAPTCPPSSQGSWHTARPCTAPSTAAWHAATGRGNPAASLRVEGFYCAPRLYSSLTTLILFPSEVSSLYSHQKATLERLQRLSPRTPAPAVYFLSGTLPTPAILHMRQLGLLYMIATLGPANILWKHGTYILHHHIKHSWFIQVWELTFQYSLPDPLFTLTSPPPLSRPGRPQCGLLRSLPTAAARWLPRPGPTKPHVPPSLLHPARHQRPPPVDHLRLLRHCCARRHHPS